MSATSGTPGGSVTFLDGSTTLGSATLDGAGVATFSTSALSPGLHTITAAYAGGSGFTSSTSAGLPQQVTDATTTTAITVTPSGSSEYGQPVSIDVTVSSSFGTPTGQVGLWVDGAERRSRALNAQGKLTFSLNLGIGAHTIKAVYTGDGTYTGSASGDVPHTVGKAATETVLSVSAPKSLPGEAVTLTANVSPVHIATTISNGIVRFQIGSLRLGTAIVDGSGMASLTTSTIPMGDHDIVAIYGGSSAFETSTSAAVSHTVSPKVGSEYRINTETLQHQERPAIAAIPNAGYVVVWASYLQDGSGSGIFGQRYDLGAGAPLGSEFRINSWLPGEQTAPAVAALADGNFIVAWQGAGAKDADGIQSQLFGVSGAKIGGEVSINTTTANEQEAPSIAALVGGGYVIIWQSRVQDGSGYGIYGRIFDADASPISDEFQIHTTTAGHQTAPSVTAAGTGFTVAWRSSDLAGLQSIMARQFTRLGNPVGGEVIVHDSAASTRSEPAVQRLTNGKILFAWSELTADFMGWNVRARFADAGALSGAPFGEPVGDNLAMSGASFSVPASTAGNQIQPALTAFAQPSGEFLAAWASFDGDGFGIFARRFNADGTPQFMTDIRVNSYLASDQLYPAIAALSAVTATATWTSNGQDGSGRGVYGQRLRFALPVQ